MRLTAVYGGLFVLMSAGLLAIFNGMFARRSSELPAAQASYDSLLNLGDRVRDDHTVVSLTLASDRSAGAQTPG